MNMDSALSCSTSVSVEEVCQFLSERGVNDNVLENLKKNKMDGYAIMACPDSQLKGMGLYAVGDILAIKNFVMQKETRDIEKMVLGRSIRDRGNDKLMKKRSDTYKVKMGLQHYCFKKPKYVGVRKCGGGRDLDFQRSATIGEITQSAILAFFPGERNYIGHKNEFQFKLANFACEEIQNEFDEQDVDVWNLEKYVKEHKLSHIRLYLLARRRSWQDVNASDSDDFEQPSFRFRGELQGTSTSMSSVIASTTRHNPRRPASSTSTISSATSNYSPEGHATSTPNISNSQPHRNLQRATRSESAISTSPPHNHLERSSISTPNNANGPAFCNTQQRTISGTTISSSQQHNNARTNRMRVCIENEVSFNVSTTTNTLGDEEIQRYFEERNQDDEIPASNDDEVILVVNETPAEVLRAAKDSYESKLSDLPYKSIIVQRSKERFWPVLFRNKFSFGKQHVGVIFAGECAADAGGPFRECLRLSMQNFPDCSPLMMGHNKSDMLFAADPYCVSEKKYEVLGELCATSFIILCRGPECLHPVLAKAIFNMDLPEEIFFGDYQFDQYLRDIDGGNYDVLLDAGIVVNHVEKAKKLFAMHYAIYSRFAAIQQFQKGVNNIDSGILEAPEVYYRYLVKTDKTIQVKDMLNLLDYNFEGEPGSNLRLLEDAAMVELEFLITDLGEGDEGYDLIDLLIFFTSFDRIPPYGFAKKIDVKFVNANRLPTVSTCAFAVQLPIKETRKNVLKALEHGNVFGNV